ncbi:MAG: SpoIID/LytB domain-containing protein [Chloroflexota bacterium]
MRIAPAMLAIFASVFIAGFAAPVQPVAAATGQCTNWKSREEPPPDIAVYRVSEGFVERVAFRDYVARVVSREWNVKQVELRKAGAVAVKQYAWYHVLRWRGGTYEGKCFDVRDTTSDQLYSSKPVEDIPAPVWQAVNATWSWRLWRGEKFPMTGYRRGADVACAENAGYRLYVRSAKRCAAKGWSASRILRVYYTATLLK